MKKVIRLLSLAAVFAATGCIMAPARVNIANERIGVCSWSWRLPMKDVAAAMEDAGVKGIHLALGPFIAPTSATARRKARTRSRS